MQVNVHKITTTHVHLYSTFVSVSISETNNRLGEGIQLLLRDVADLDRLIDAATDARGQLANMLIERAKNEQQLAELERAKNEQQLAELERAKNEQQLAELAVHDAEASGGENAAADAQHAAQASAACLSDLQRQALR